MIAQLATASGGVAVAMDGIVKSYGGVRALREVSFTARRGEVHALLGENGAGKSTILRILRGVDTPNAGTITVAGQTHLGLTPTLARTLGIGMIFQEMSLVPELTVAQNVFLTREPTTRSGLIDDVKMQRKATEIFASMGVRIDPAAKVADLTTGQQQLTEIAKALSEDASILILDEPTSALTAREVEVLFDLIRRLKAEGRAIIYVSHRMDEIFRIADAATVLRDGRLIGSRPIAQYTLASLIADIMGKTTRDLSEFATASTATSEVMLETRNLRAEGRQGGATLTLHRGEVLGLAGLLGSGRTRLARMLFGLEKPLSGSIVVRGRETSIDTPAVAKSLKMAFVPGDRRHEGLVLQHSIEANSGLPILDLLGRSIFVNRRKSRSKTKEIIDRLGIKASGLNAAVSTLSGGNQQKVVIGKWLATEPEVLIMDEPTAGIDIGSKGAILRLVRELVSEGKSILFISSELTELIAVSDRIAVMAEGRVTEVVEKSSLIDSDCNDRAEHRLQMIVQKGGQNVRN